MIKYSVLTLANKSYFKFLQILVNSFLEKCDLSKVNNFFIIDTGLTLDQLNYLKNKHDLIKIISSELQTDYEGGPWGKDWLSNVTNKTSFFSQLFEHIKSPLMMLDSDMMITSDLYSLIKLGGDVQVCIRPNHTTKYIGSYCLALDYKKSNKFIYDWSQEVQSTNIKPPESPSLVKMVGKYKNELDIIEINESIVNEMDPNNVTDKTKIVHFKGSDLINDLEFQYNKRIDKRGWKSYVEKYLKDYV
tara:strand:+ start:12585 stop:13322 length:738 start_codon:yes stop_codon:yes gene_type:complete